jgi:exopolysaccharide biosynthesis polyprenyl glycosylphosphotransferase
MKGSWKKPTILPLHRTRRNQIVISILLVGDFFLISAAFWLAYLIRFKFLAYPAPYDPVYYFQIITVNSFAWIGIFWIYQLYSTKILFGGIGEYSRVLSAITLGSALLVFYDFFSNRDQEASRGWLILVWLLSIVLIVLFRFVVRRSVYSLHRRGHLMVPALIINADDEGKELYQQLAQFPHSGLSVRGFIDNHLPRGTKVSDYAQVLGSTDDLMQVVSALGIEDVIVATGSISREELLDIYRCVAWKPGVKLRLTSGLFEIMSTGLHIKELVNIPLIEVNKVRITGMNLVIKTAIDYVVAILGLVLLSPFFFLIAILIRLDSPGPIFYKHRVLGLYGKQFMAYKFRTMVQNSQEILQSNPELQKAFNENYKLKDDPRVTRFGRILRRASLDELPQLINILRGEMSLVGPRFITPAEMPKFGKWGMNLLTVKPGITGLWQISGRSDTSYEERVRLDMHYIRNWNLWDDIYVLLVTIPAALKQRGAY